MAVQESVPQARSSGRPFETSFHFDLDYEVMVDYNIALPLLILAVANAKFALGLGASRFDQIAQNNHRTDKQPTSALLDFEASHDAYDVDVDVKPRSLHDFHGVDTNVPTEIGATTLLEQITHDVAFSSEQREARTPSSSLGKPRSLRGFNGVDTNVSIEIESPTLLEQIAQGVAVSSEQREASTPSSSHGDGGSLDGMHGQLSGGVHGPQVSLHQGGSVNNNQSKHERKLNNVWYLLHGRANPPTRPPTATRPPTRPPMGPTTRPNRKPTRPPTGQPSQSVRAKSYCASISVDSTLITVPDISSFPPQLAC